MGIDPQQLHDYVVKPACIFIDGKYRPEVAQLLMGTCAQESHMGKYLQQLGGGPAAGIFQMERPAYIDNWDNYLAYKSELAAQIRTEFSFGKLSYDQIRTNLLFAAVMCRVDYKRESRAIPKFNDVEGHARYWKEYWNSMKGKGTVVEYMHNWDQFKLHRVVYK